MPDSTTVLVTIACNHDRTKCGGIERGDARGEEMGSGDFHDVHLGASDVVDLWMS